MDERELENIYGGQHPDAVQEFLKPGELTVEDLDNVIMHPNRQAAVEKQLENEGLFREKSAEAEMMFQELYQQKPVEKPQSRQL
jgi:hypothetical protein